jgi:hypothetical protein
MTRRTSDKMMYRPRCYKWFAEGNIVEKVFIPIENNMVTDSHIIVAGDKNYEDVFVLGSNEDQHSDLQLEENFIQFFRDNVVSEDLQQIIWDYMEEENVYIKCVKTIKDEGKDRGSTKGEANGRGKIKRRVRLP